MIYFIQNEATLAIKVGYTENVKGRLSSLRTSCADRLRLLGTISGGMAEERAIHARFAADRLSGEWFRPSPALVDFIRAELIHRGGASPRSTAAITGPHEAYWTSNEGRSLVLALEDVASAAVGMRVALSLVNVGAIDHIAADGRTPYVPRYRWQATEDVDVPDDMPFFDTPVEAIRHIVASILPAEATR